MLDFRAPLKPLLSFEDRQINEPQAGILFGFEEYLALLNLGDAEGAQSKSVGHKRKQLMIPKGTYVGQDQGVSTTTLEVSAIRVSFKSDVIIFS